MGANHTKVITMCYFCYVVYSCIFNPVWWADIMCTGIGLQTSWRFLFFISEFEQSSACCSIQGAEKLKTFLREVILFIVQAVEIMSLNSCGHTPVRNIFITT